MGLVQNSCLYIRYRSSSNITTAEWCKQHTDKHPSLLYCESYSQSSTSVPQSHKNQRKTFGSVWSSSFLSSSSSITWKLHSVYDVLYTKRLLYYCRCSFLVISCVLDMTGKLWPQFWPHKSTRPVARKSEEVELDMGVACVHVRKWVWQWSKR